MALLLKTGEPFLCVADICFKNLVADSGKMGRWEQVGLPTRIPFSHFPHFECYSYWSNFLRVNSDFIMH